VIRVMVVVITSIPLKWQWSNGIGRAGDDFVTEEVFVVLIVLFDEGGADFNGGGVDSYHQ
jgi:hypothetical protein